MNWLIDLKNLHLDLYNSHQRNAYIIRNSSNRNLVLDVSNSNTANGTRIIVSPIHYGTNQRFRLQSL
ncbi:RICIN domain-containing protein [Bacillus thuringiensis]|uniref:RICIN domain-containing protein n=1 Tax=Bacillus thuringiensis TaxID=1428 RepID=A0AAW9GNG2_BACTU|nr:RICIN domain-containing protein [Bacillus thuringiensis]MDY0855434.1 RICIN domain-containing protein [Bacillus thuringiensis]MDY4395344.1 RICIN domain-containing protein [Bacillus thuringiensis]